MWADGIDVRPLKQMTGGEEFNEVWFNGVRIPDENRLGEVDGGWHCARTTLMNERIAIAGLSLDISAVVGGSAQARPVGDPARRAWPTARTPPCASASPSSGSTSRCARSTCSGRTPRARRATTPAPRARSARC